MKQWVRENIGLTDDTFSSSVLLKQGQADRLIGAKPGDRFKILSGVVDLESYRRLHERAEVRRRARKVVAETSRARLRSLPTIEDAAIEGAEGRLAEAEEARIAAGSAWERRVEAEGQARTWADLVVRRIGSRTSFDRSEAILSESAAITRDADRLRDLDAALPIVREAIERRRKVEVFLGEIAGLEALERDLSRRLDLIAALNEDNGRHRQTLIDEIGRDEARRGEILKRRAALAPAIQRCRQSRDQRAEIGRLEAALGSHPANLAETVETLDSDVRLRLDWKAAMPRLETIASERECLRKAAIRVEAARRSIEAAELVEKKVRASIPTLGASEADARDTEHEARAELTRRETLLALVRSRIDQFEGLRESPRCDRCGQVLTPEHFASEEERLRIEVIDAGIWRDKATADLSEAQAVAKTAADELKSAELALRDAEADAERATRDADEGDRDAERARKAFANAYTALDNALRGRIASDPSETRPGMAFPAEADLEEGRLLVAEAAGLEARLKKARIQLDAVRDDETRLDQARQTLAKIGTETADEGSEAEDAALLAECEAIDRCLRGHATERRLADQTLAKLAECSAQIHDRRVEAGARLATLRGRQESLMDEQDRARSSAPEAWREILDHADEDCHSDWEAERARLRDGEVERREAELPGARAAMERAREELEAIALNEAVIPEDARVDPEVAAARREEAKLTLDFADADRRKRQNDLDRLHGDAERRRDVEAVTLAAERDLEIAATLSEFLGSKGLQRDLIREAERGIVDLANPILKDVSGDELALRLLDSDEGEGDHALPLEALVRTHGRTRALKVDFLSGSQQFRVAVALALAIGQYARVGRERPIDAVIIDEGFGCLDPQGRDEMVAVIGSLRGRLSRVVLVTHQEEIAEAFPDGYRFEVSGGATVARPFHR